MYADIAGIVVAGGCSRRLGQDKRRLRLWGPEGPTLLHHTLAILSPYCAELIVVLNDEQAWPHLPARIVTDRFPDSGALGGLYSGLAAATAPYTLVVAADMPLLNADLLQAMLSYPRHYAALVPRTAPPCPATAPIGRVEPLHAVYNRACLATLQQMLTQGMRRMTDLLAAVHTIFMEPAEIARYDPSGYAFLNINTPDDLAQAQCIIRGKAD